MAYSLKCAPVPISWYRGCDIFHRRKAKRISWFCVGYISFGSHCGCWRSPRCGEGHGARLAVVTALPGFELLITVVTGTGRRCARIKVGLFIEWDRSVRVVIAKDIATLTTVMTPCKVVEGSLACGIVTDVRFGIRLFEKKNQCEQKILCSMLSIASSLS